MIGAERAQPGGEAMGTTWWQDGVLIADHSDITYITVGNSNGFYSYEWAPYWGGGSSGMSAKTRADYVLTDQLHISGVVR